jgi:cytosine/adenosine deaminase-related metal-dependent hydrolase
MNTHTPSASSAYGNCIHRAGWVVSDPWSVINNGYVLVESGKIREIGKYGKKSPTTENYPLCDHGPGALIPALVNAHTHLELSCFKDKITCEQGFGQWVRDLLNLRENSTTAEMTAGAKLGLNEILDAGTGAICEISSLGTTAEITADSGIHGLWCREILGNLAAGLDAEPAKLSGNIKASLAGHAPHTTSPRLITHLKQISDKHNLPFSLHLSESVEEMEFIGTGRGAWADFLLSRGIDFSSWGLPARSPVAYMDSLGILDERTIAVHVLQADENDLDILAQRRAKVCLCPRSNQALHSLLPDIPAMLTHGIRLCLGTDSLASTLTLDMFDEMAFIAENYDSVEPSQILQMATINGAAAVSQFMISVIARGVDPNMVYVPVTCSRKLQVLESIVNKDFNEPCLPLLPAACN